MEHKAVLKVKYGVLGNALGLPRGCKVERIFEGEGCFHVMISYSESIHHGNQKCRRSWCEDDEVIKRLKYAGYEIEAP